MTKLVVVLMSAGVGYVVAWLKQRSKYEGILKSIGKDLEKSIQQDYGQK